MRAVQRLLSVGAIVGLVCFVAPGCGGGDRYDEGNAPRGAVSGAGATTTTTMGHRTPPPPANNP
jgi:hypothetical protein